METKNIAVGIGGIILGGALFLGATANSATYQKVSDTDMQINTSVSIVVSLDTLKTELANAQAARQEEVNRSQARIAEFDAYIADHQAKIAKAIEIGVKDAPVSVEDPK